ncbi:hypothetical protein [Cerasicoccus frondis]|uniref:hypothetical protein n=1 Tax=Cerasicoccus frondis TaxID=490090 RepID=UPI00285270E6|nr:hypothetical protein [Cerasicoccus frondis]
MDSFFRVLFECPELESDLEKELELNIEYNLNPIKDLAELLLHIEQHPAMYLGGESIDFLYSFISGIDYFHKIFNIKFTFTDSFETWLRSNKEMLPTIAGWSQFILIINNFSYTKSLQSFFRLFEEWAEANK